MAREVVIAVRTSAEVRAATEKAAEDDGRSMSAYVERLLIASLKKAGHLPK